MGIVGHKIEQWLTAERKGHRHWEVTSHRVVTELHATKGWRGRRHVKQVQHVARLPTIRQWREADVTMFEPIHGRGQGNRSRPLRGIRP